MHDFLQLRSGLVKPIDQNCIIHGRYNSNRSHASFWKRCGQLTVHLVVVVTAPWRQGSVSWEGSDGKRWILCSCCALLSKEMSCADPNKVEGRLTPVTGSRVCPSKRKGTQDVCLPEASLQGWEKWRAVTSRIYTASGKEGWKNQR